MKNLLQGLVPDAIHVWCIHLSQSSDVVRALAHHLSERELNRANRHRHEIDRSRYVVAHGAVRELLAGYTAQTPMSVSFGCTETGKPFLINDEGGPHIRFNLSHSGEWALLAVARSTEVGIDIERVDPKVSVEDVAERFFSPSEFKALQSVCLSKRASAFFAAWARKEAYVKARGEGISGRFRRFCVSIDTGESPKLLSDEIDTSAASSWWIEDLDVACGYAASIAARCPTREIQLMRWAEPLY